MKRKAIPILLISVMIFTLLAACSSDEADVGLSEPENTIETVSPEAVSSDDIVSMGEDPAPDESTGNKIKNGDFSNGTSEWSLYLEGGGSAGLEAGDAGFGVISIKTVGNVPWGVQLYQDGVALTSGNVYRLSFDASSDVPRQVFIRIQLNASPYTGYMEELLLLGPEISHYDFAFTMNENSDPGGRLVLNLGTDQLTGEKPDPEEHNITVGNFELLLMEGDEGTFTFEDFLDIPPIRVNQVGYSPNSVKRAILLTDDASFEVCDASTDAVVFTGTASELIYSPSAEEDVRIADFSTFTNEGRYIVKNSDGESYPFDIREDLYADAMDAIFYFYEYQKCGVAADLDIWSYGACHTSPATIWDTEETRDVSGGWHDAGDYGRYVVPSAKAVTDLLLAHELTPAVSSEILDIVRYQLEWMLKMQDPDTGGVYHKVTTASFSGTIMPDKDLDPLYLSPISPTASGSFAASLAFASRVYRSFDRAFADELLAAAEKAWVWLDSDRFHTAFKNPDGINTGEYYDSTSLDERLWAACELYSATGKTVYHDYILGVTMNERVRDGLGWDKTGDYASISYLFMPESTTAPRMRETMQKNVLENCERIMEFYETEPYAVSLGEDYPWGSNMHVANNAVLLMVGNTLEPNPAYVDAAMEHLHYLLGRNALSQSYITGFGTQSPMHPHHRPSEVAGEPVPGMVVGGPNGNLEDPFVATWLSGFPPAKCYADSDQSYSTNEVTIYWNSPVYLLMALLS